MFICVFPQILLYLSHVPWREGLNCYCTPTALSARRLTVRWCQLRHRRYLWLTLINILNSLREVSGLRMRPFCLRWGFFHCNKVYYLKNNLFKREMECCYIICTRKIVRSIAHLTTSPNSSIFSLVESFTALFGLPFVWRYRNELKAHCRILRPLTLMGVLSEEEVHCIHFSSLCLETDLDKRTDGRALPVDLYPHRWWWVVGGAYKENGSFQGKERQSWMLFQALIFPGSLFPMSVQVFSTCCWKASNSTPVRLQLMSTLATLPRTDLWPQVTPAGR